MTLYDAIGRNYSQTRKRDPRIAVNLLEILQSSQGSTIVDIGAGTGSYATFLAEHGYRVIAVEPSSIMREQAIAHPAIQWVDARAENLPLPSSSAGAAIIMLAFHHFQDYSKALEEINRVTGNGQIIVFTYDPSAIADFWLTKYFPSFTEDVRSTFLPISNLVSELEAVTGKTAKITDFPLPYDLSDSFAAVGWGRPEVYLNSKIRNGISSFAKLEATELDRGLSCLKEDLESGVWEREFGYLRKQQQYDVGYRFVYSS
ncbi:methyltransferase domain-containing protein [Mastigocoleus sp. MO_188.B34]|uniref:class I SAM-dependent methyltransferase n=1 Tax=Mastigocoleus sp. MO_188.B34 TaxID=3036635 RepID=UPI0026285031|nr:methyltransferase domain-containing protein [Mastigocoleus sp. MO_188.B34]MDJ0695565.1 methyltransferase domain-containing protein [Mastigocoleus sp. MO_188.B34]